MLPDAERELVAAGARRAVAQCQVEKSVRRQVVRVREEPSVDADLGEHGGRVEAEFLENARNRLQAADARSAVGRAGPGIDGAEIVGIHTLSF